MISGIDMEQIDFAAIYNKPAWSKIESINFENISEILRSKFFVSVKKFYTSSLKDVLKLINLTKPSDNLKIDAIEKALQYRANNYYGGYNYYGNYG